MFNMMYRRNEDNDQPSFGADINDVDLSPLTSDLRGTCALRQDYFADAEWNCEVLRLISENDEGGRRTTTYHLSGLTLLMSTFHL